MTQEQINKAIEETRALLNTHCDTARTKLTPEVMDSLNEQAVALEAIELATGSPIPIMITVLTYMHAKCQQADE